MAEGLLCLTQPGDPTDILDNSQGRPMCDADEVRIVDEDGADVPAGETGELLVRGPYTLKLVAVSALPLTAVGKIDKRALLASLTG
ncbi:mycobactin-specific salicyl-AMP ligase [Mycobacteroides abscessus subsp. abscessus]|nr:mycobactin-specific salicyl-AMP ligase [Mycobacteroides abscessus subsp. abscessus]